MEFFVYDMAIMTIVDHQPGNDQKPRRGRSRRPKGSGPGKLSKMVMDRVKDAETLRGAIVELRHLAAAGLGERLGPFLGEPRRSMASNIGGWLGWRRQ